MGSADKSASLSLDTSKKSDKAAPEAAPPAARSTQDTCRIPLAHLLDNAHKEATRRGTHATAGHIQVLALAVSSLTILMDRPVPIEEVELPAELTARFKALRQVL